MTGKVFYEVIDYLAGKFISLEDRHIYAKIWHDEDTGYDRKERKDGKSYVHDQILAPSPMKQGVIVKIGDQVMGTIDEAFLEKTQARRCIRSRRKTPISSSLAEGWLHR